MINEMKMSHEQCCATVNILVSHILISCNKSKFFISQVPIKIRLNPWDTEWIIIIEFYFASEIRWQYIPCVWITKPMFRKKGTPCFEFLVNLIINYIVFLLNNDPYTYTCMYERKSRICSLKVYQTFRIMGMK